MRRQSLKPRNHISHFIWVPFRYKSAVWSVMTVVLFIGRFHVSYIQGLIQNFPDWCRHLHSSCDSAKHRYMVGQPCLASQRAKFHVGGMTWAVFTRVYLESCT